MDMLHLGPTPCNEDCQQLGPNYNAARAMRESRVFIDQLQRHFGTPPGDACFSVQHCNHDFGTYLEVAIKFNPNNEEEVDFAFNVENKAPHNWDQEALNKLNLQERE